MMFPHILVPATAVPISNLTLPWVRRPALRMLCCVWEIS